MIRFLLLLLAVAAMAAASPIPRLNFNFPVTMRTYKIPYGTSVHAVTGGTVRAKNGGVTSFHAQSYRKTQRMVV